MNIKKNPFPFLQHQGVFRKCKRCTEKDNRSYTEGKYCKELNEIDFKLHLKDSVATKAQRHEVMICDLILVP